MFKALARMVSKGRWFDNRPPMSSGLLSDVPLRLADRAWNVSADNNSIVMAATRWVMRNVTEPSIIAQRWDSGENSWEEMDFHVAEEVMRRPNELKGARRRLLQGFALSWVLDGNAYALIDRAGPRGMVNRLEYLPHTACDPIMGQGPGEAAVLGYRIWRWGRSETVPVDRVLHLADGIDPTCTAKGLSPMKCLMRSVLTDHEIHDYSLAIMQNFGVTSGLVSPASDTASFSRESADDFKKKWFETTTGARRGEPIVSAIPVKVDQLGLSPESMAIDKLARLPEQRITAVLGLPAIVCGVGAGLERSTFANYAEARRAACSDYLVPLWNAWSEDFTDQILPLAGGRDGERLWFDQTEVRELQEDENKRHERVRLNYKEGLLLRSEARSAIGYDPLAGDEVYLGTIEPYVRLVEAGIDPAAAAQAVGVPEGLIPLLSRRDFNDDALTDETEARSTAAV